MYLLTGLGLLSMALSAENICVSTPNTSLVINASEGQELKFIYYGEKLSEDDLKNISSSGLPQFPAYPVYGMNCPGEAALAVKHADGNMSLQMEVEKTASRTENNAVITTITMKDKVYPFYIDVCYKAYQDADVIETWTEISHGEKKAGGTEPVRFGLPAHPQRKRMALVALWLVGKRRASGTRSARTGHEGHQEQGRGAQLAYGPR